MQRITYEWTVEQVNADEHEDIEDVYAVDSYAEARRATPLDGCFTRICVVRDRFDAAGELVYRCWAYVTDGRLPECFEGAGYDTDIRVPKRFHNEIANTSKEN